MRRTEIGRGDVIGALGELCPRIAASAFVAEDAVVLGDVEVGRDASIWYGCVLRGDVGPLRVGAATNLQEGTIVHCARDNEPTVIGSRVTVGHGVILHGCRVGDRSLIGMRATLMDGVEIGEECIVGAGALVPPGTVVPARSVLLGSPATFSRRVTDEDLEWILGHADHYVESRAQYLKSGYGKVVAAEFRREDG